MEEHESRRKSRDQLRRSGDIARHGSASTARSSPKRSSPAKSAVKTSPYFQKASTASPSKNSPESDVKRQKTEHRGKILSYFAAEKEISSHASSIEEVDLEYEVIEDTPLSDEEAQPASMRHREEDMPLTASPIRVEKSVGARARLNFSSPETSPTHSSPSSPMATSPDLKDKFRQWSFGSPSPRKTTETTSPSSSTKLKAKRTRQKKLVASDDEAEKNTERWQWLVDIRDKNKRRPG